MTKKKTNVRSKRMGSALQQVEAQATARLAAKLPTWAATPNLLPPPRLAFEQCSGETAARYKAAVVARLLPDGGTMADLTGGYGVDFVHIARRFNRAIYVERQAELCDLVRHNFPLLGLTNAEVWQGDAVEEIDKLPALDFLLIDPARRDSAGRKTVLIADCEPDVAALMPRLLEKAPLVMMKLSPMLDISNALQTLAPHVIEVHVVAAKGEVKELLLLLTPKHTNEPMLHVVDGQTHLAMPLTAESEAFAPIATTVGRYLYEPSAAVLKAGLFRWVAQHYGIAKLHPNTHLYTADHIVTDFPGRTFIVRSVSGFSKQALRELCIDTPKVNIAVRNFPSTVSELRKRLKVGDGGDAYWFATTLTDNKHVIIDCRRLSANSPATMSRGDNNVGSDTSDLTVIRND